MKNNFQRKAFAVQLYSPQIGRAETPEEQREAQPRLKFLPTDHGRP
jgi:hypothetical protein